MASILVDVVLPLSLAFIMFSLGLGLTPADFARVIQRPKAFALGAINQVLLLPVVAFAIVIAFGFQAEIAIGFMILAACPGGVTSNVISKLAKADVALSVSLTAVISLLSALTVPILLAWSLGYFMDQAAPDVDITGIAIAMFALTVVPISIGLIARLVASKMIERIEPMIGRIATVLFALIVIAALAANWKLFTENVATLAPAVIVLNALLLAFGFLVPLALGLARREAKTVSIETGIQNATLGITVAALLLPGNEGLGAYALPAAMYGIMMYVVTLPVLFWFRQIDA
ncbi:MAG: bile acid:sodium symporter family protein [Pseudomonadota bacterium]